MKEGGVGEEVEQECTSLPSSPSNDILPAPIDDILTSTTSQAVVDETTGGLDDGAWGRSGRHYGWGGSSIPPLHPTQQSTIY